MASYEQDLWDIYRAFRFYESALRSSKVNKKGKAIIEKKDGVAEHLFLQWKTEWLSKPRIVPESAWS